MSEETNTPVEAVEAPKKTTTKVTPKPKAEPTVREKSAALTAERADIQERLVEITAELKALSAEEAAKIAAQPKKSDHDRWMEQKAITAARKEKQNTKKAEIQKVLSELGLA